MADAAPADTALTEAFKKVVGDPANPAGLTPAGGAAYATPAGSRPAGDVINISQAPGLMYTPAEQWAHESDLARQAQNTLEQNRQYDLSKAKFDYDKQQQQWQNDAAMNQALALRQSMRRPMTLSTYGGGGGGYSGGGGGYSGNPYAGWNRVSDGGLPPTMSQSNPAAYQRTIGRQANMPSGEYTYNVPGNQSQFIMAPANLEGPALGKWMENRMKQAKSEGLQSPPIITKRTNW